MKALFSRVFGGGDTEGAGGARQPNAAQPSAAPPARGEAATRDKERAAPQREGAHDTPPAQRSTPLAQPQIVSAHAFAPLPLILYNTCAPSTAETVASHTQALRQLAAVV